LHGNCLLKHVIDGKIEGRIEVTGRQGRRRKHLLDDLEEKRGYCKQNEEEPDRILRRNRFGRGYGPVVRQNTQPIDMVYSLEILGYSFVLTWLTT